MSLKKSLSMIFIRKRIHTVYMKYNTWNIFKQNDSKVEKILDCGVIS